MRRNLSRLYLALLVFFSLVIPLIAQESTQEPITPTETTLPSPTLEPTVTIIPSETPLPTAAPEITEAPILTVAPEISETATYTEFPTQEMSASPTAQTPISTPTLEAEPSLTSIVSEPFLNTSVSDWTIGAAWQFVPMDGNFALQVTDNESSVNYNAGEFNDVVLEMLFQTQNANFVVNLRQSPVESYQLHLNPNGELKLYRGLSQMATVSMPALSSGLWHLLRFSAIGNNLRIAVDSLEVLTLSDENTLTSGGISFSAYSANQGESYNLLVDNIRIWIPTEQYLATPTATTLPTPTEISSVTSSQMIVGRTDVTAPTNFELIHKSNFDQIPLDLSMWQINGSMEFVTVDNSNAILLGSQSSLIFTERLFQNVMVSADFLITTEPAQIQVRSTETDLYKAELHPSGLVELYKGELLIDSVSIGQLQNGAWYNFKITALEDMLHVTVNDSIILAVSDPLGITEGNIIVGGGNNQIIVDNIILETETSDASRGQSSEGTIAYLGPTIVSVSTTSELIAALENANGETCNAPIIINLTASTYTLTQSHATSYAGATGLPRIHCDVTINGLPTMSTIRRANSAPPFRIILAMRPNSYDPINLTINNIILEGGETTFVGGGIYSLGPTTLNNVIIRDNEATGGAGIYSDGSPLLIQNTTIENNEAVANSSGFGGYGGGVYTQASYVSTTIRQSIIRNNQAVVGGGLSVGGSGGLFKMEYSTVEDNSASQGGGLYLPHGYDTDYNTINYVLFQNNQAGSGNAILGRTFYSTGSCFINNRGTNSSSYDVAFIDSVSGGLPNMPNNWWNGGFGPVSLASSEAPETADSRITTAFSSYLSAASNCGYAISIPPTSGFSVGYQIVMTGGASINQELYILNTSGDVLPFTDTAYIQESKPVFSPDGTRIAFQRVINGNWDIWVKNVSDPLSSLGTQLTFDASMDLNPVWSPDGTRIAFVRGNSIRAVYTVGNLDENELLNFGTLVDDLAWSPDGRWLLFTSGADLYRLSIYCRGAECIKPLLETHNIQEPAWSPDGTKIAFGQGGDLVIANVVYDANAFPSLPIGLGTPTPIEVPTPDSVESNPSWSTDGESIIFNSDRSGYAQVLIYSLELATLEPSPIINQGYSPDISQYVACPNTNTFRIDPSINPNAGDYSLLTSENVDFNTRKWCWYEYRGIIFAAIYHETSNNRIFGFNEVGLEIDRLAQTNSLGRFTISDDYVVMHDINAFSNFAIVYDHRYLFARAILNGMLSNNYAPIQVNPMRYFARNFSCTVDRQDCLNGLVKHDNNPGWLGGNFAYQCPIYDENPNDEFLDSPIKVVKDNGDVVLVYPCLDRGFYNILMNENLSGTNWLNGYRDIMPQIYTAVFDTIANASDPLQGGIGSRTANRQVIPPQGGQGISTFVTSLNRTNCETLEDAYMRQIQGPRGTPIVDGPVNRGFYPVPVTNIVPIVDNFPPRVTNGLNGNPFQTSIGLSSDVIHVHYLFIPINASGIVQDIVWVTQVFDSPIQDGYAYTTYPINRNPDYPETTGTSFDYIFNNNNYRTSPTCN